MGRGGCGWGRRGGIIGVGKVSKAGAVKESLGWRYARKKERLFAIIVFLKNKEERQWENVCEVDWWWLAGSLGIVELIGGTK